MRTEDEIREWLSELNAEIPTTRPQQIALSAAVETLKWALNDPTPGGNA